TPSKPVIASASAASPPNWKPRTVCSSAATRRVKTAPPSSPVATAPANKRSATLDEDAASGPRFFCAKKIFFNLTLLQFAPVYRRDTHAHRRVLQQGARHAKAR